MNLMIAAKIGTALAVVFLAVSWSIAEDNWWIGGLLLGAYTLAVLFDWRRSKARNDAQSRRIDGANRGRHNDLTPE